MQAISNISHERAVNRLLDQFADGFAQCGVMTSGVRSSHFQRIIFDLKCRSSHHRIISVS
jgi:hypothetical protein